MCENSVWKMESSIGSDRYWKVKFYPVLEENSMGRDLELIVLNL